MSLDDLKRIDWKHATLQSLPTYVLVGFALILVGILLVIAGAFL